MGKTAVGHNHEYSFQIASGLPKVVQESAESRAQVLEVVLGMDTL